MSSARRVVAVAVTAMAALVALAVPSGASQYQPDGLIRYSGAASFRGNGIYNQTADNQTVEVRITASDVADFYVAIQNDGSSTDTFRLNGSSHTTRFSVKYFIDGRDVSTQVKAANEYVTLAPGEQEMLRVRIATRTSVPKGTSFKVDVRDRSNNSGEVDVTRARVTRPLYSNEQLTVQSQINNTRAANGRPSLPMNRTLANKAQDWAAHLAAIGRLEHSNLASGVPAGWEALAENVGYYTTLAGVHQAFLDSSPHRANILGPYNYVGTGVAHRGSWVYVVHVFMRT